MALMLLCQSPLDLSRERHVLRGLAAEQALQAVDAVEKSWDWDTCTKLGSFTL